MYATEINVEPTASERRTLEYAEKLAGGIAHDFNNLLMAIIGHTDMLAEYFTSGDPRAVEVDAIRRAADRATTLTGQLTAFSRQQRIEATVLNLNDMLKRTRRTLERIAGDQIELGIVQGQAVQSVKADAAQVEQILLTLAVNAREAMPEGGALTIGTGNVRVDDLQALRLGVEPGAYVELSITDTGVGMDAEAQKHLFKPFFTTDTSGIRPGRSYACGLGLATVHGMVKQSGGHIVLESEAGRGSRFGVRFPATPEDALPAAPKRAAASQGGTETVLLVEDDDSVRGLIGDVLRRRGYEVLLAADGVEAVRLAVSRDAEIHLLVTDVVMGDMSGVDVARTLRATRPNLKVLYVSGFTNDTTVTTESDDHTYLPKPFTPEALARKVRATLTGLYRKGA